MEKTRREEVMWEEGGEEGSEVEANAPPSDFSAIGAVCSEDSPPGAQWRLFSPPYISLFFLKVSATLTKKTVPGRTWKFQKQTKANLKSGVLCFLKHKSPIHTRHGTHT